MGGPEPGRGAAALAALGASQWVPAYLAGLILFRWFHRLASSPDCPLISNGGRERPRAVCGRTAPGFSVAEGGRKSKGEMALGVELLVVGSRLSVR